MRIGALVRTEQRGLGIQSRAFLRHMGATPLVIDIPNASAHVCPADFSLFPDALRVRVAAGWRLPERVVRRWLEDLDVVWTAETFYDDRLTEWARVAGVATAIHANPEFVTPSLAGYGFGRPDAWWSATSWRIDRMPQGTDVVPWPVELPTDGWEHPRPSAPARFLHIAGRAAMGDRNGTAALVDALPYLREPCHVTICSQDGAIPLPRVPRHVTVATWGPQEDLTAAWREHDVLVMPRRYGGLCLPVGEAMAHGLAVLMPDIDPNPDAWPAHTFAAALGPTIQAPCGPLQIADIDSRRLAAAMDELADPKMRHGWQDESEWWATTNRWEVRAPVMQARLEELRAIALA